MTDERIFFYNNNDNAVESVTFAGEGFTKVVTQGKICVQTQTYKTCSSQYPAVPTGAR